MAVMSFAHLKGKKVKQDCSANNPAPNSAIIVVVEKVRLQRPMAIGAIKTALLAAVNYCQYCPRFWPSDENEKAQGVEYGRCCRLVDDDGNETWRIIPVTARVAQCWWHLHRPFKESECKTEVINCIYGKCVPVETKP